jgi:TPR repeat protein
MPGIVYLFHNQSLPGIYRIGSCLISEEVSHLQTLNEGYYGDGEFYCIHTKECENHELAVRLIEEDLEKTDKKVAGKRFFKLLASEAIQLIDDYVVLANKPQFKNATNNEDGIQALQDEINWMLASTVFYSALLSYQGEEYDQAIEKYTEAAELLVPFVRNGNAQALEMSATCYESMGAIYKFCKEQSEGNLLSAINYYKLALDYDSVNAEKEIADAYYSLGSMFKNPPGKGVPNYEKAIKYYSEALIIGNTALGAQEIGDCYLHGGYGINKDFLLAVRYLKLSTDDTANYLLGTAFRELRKFKEAEKYFGAWISNVELYDLKHEVLYYCVFDAFEFYEKHDFIFPQTIISNRDIISRVEDYLNEAILIILNGAFDGNAYERNHPHVIEKYTVLHYFRLVCKNQNG